MKVLRQLSLSQTVEAHQNRIQKAECQKVECQEAECQKVEWQMEALLGEEKALGVRSAVVVVHQTVCVGASRSASWAAPCADSFPGHLAASADVLIALVREPYSSSGSFLDTFRQRLAGIQEVTYKK